MQRKDLELMAPVGSYESLHAAIAAGADSVYLGIEQLNMRSRSSNNFTQDDLREIARIARESGVKTYLTVNTVIYDKELPLMRQIVETAKEAEVTAIIASDLAVIEYARQIGVEVHISTQCNVSNTEALRFFSRYADVVVLARELDMDQVANIHKNIIEQDIRGPRGELVQIEMFAHGALCMAVSGKCYLSLNTLGSSANRGACLQICRRKYLVHDVETGNQLEVDGKYIMSPKDLKTIGFLDRMVNSGVRVFKIEGRARSADYVKTVCECYNEALQEICDGTYNEESRTKWDEKLSTVFNRGFWDGYYQGQTMGEWTNNSGNLATEKKVFVGTVRNYFNKVGVAEIQLETGDLSIGDKTIIMGPTTGCMDVNVSELRVDLKPVEKSVKGDLFSMPVPDRVRKNDKLYKIIDAKLVKDNQ
ncbi:MAG: peptidase U32 family protein [Bacteroidia bacterium]|nr:peptidase U32 family protein [Bacteroidia bacterium]